MGVRQSSSLVGCRSESLKLGRRSTVWRRRQEADAASRPAGRDGGALSLW